VYGHGATGIIDTVMVLILTLLFPLLLLALPLLMERVERPLRSQRTADARTRGRSPARPEDLEDIARQGYAPAVERFWRRRRIGSLRPERGGLRG
jgi:hypothetical protein